MARRRVLWACLGLAIVLSACDESPEARETAYLEKAQEYAQAGDAAAAIIELKNALTENPENAKTRAQLGGLYLQTGDANSAAKEFQRARQLGLADDTVRLRLVQSWLLLGDYQAVLKELPEDPAVSDDVSADLAAARGEALFSMGEVDAAAALMNMVADSHGSAGAYAGLASIALFRNDPDGAETALREGRSKYPEDARLATLEGEVLARQHQFGEAQAAFEEAIRLEPRHFGARLGLVRTLIGQQKLEDAKLTLDQLTEETPNSLDAILLRSVVALQSGDYVAAQQDANKVLATNDGNASAQFVAGASSYALNQSEQAVRSLARYLAQAPGDVSARKLLAASYLKLGNAAEADRILGGVGDPASQDDQYLSLLSATAVLRGDSAKGLQYLEQAVVRSPEDAALRARLGYMRIATGDLTQGALDLDEAIQLNPELDADPTIDAAERSLILAHIRRGEYDAAIKLAEELQQESPESTSGFVLAGIAYMANGQETEARAAFAEALKIQPGAPDATANLAMLEYQAGNPDAAKALLLTAHEQYPAHLNTMLLLGRLAAQQGNYDETKDWANKAIAAQPQSPAPRIMLSRLMLREQNAGEALAALQPLLSSDVADADVLELAGTAQLMLGRNDDATGLLKKLVAAAPNRAQAHFLLAKAYGQSGNASQAKQELTSALNLDATHGPAKLALARLLVLEGDAANAQPIVAELRASFPDSPEVALLRADLALLQNDAAAAVPILQTLQPSDGSGRVTATLARAQWQAGDRAAAANTLEDWLSRHPTDTGMRLELSRYYAADGKIAEAKATLAAITEADPEDWVGRNELAYLLYQQGEIEAAQPLAEKAYELSDKHPMVADTLAVILMAQDQAEKALPLMRSAAAQLPSLPQVSFHLAQALVGTGKMDEAREVLTAMLKRAGSFDEREQAEALLLKLGG